MEAGTLSSLEALHRRRQVFRLTFGMAASSGLAFGLAWPLAFITPVLAVKLLSTPKVPPFKMGLTLILLLGGALLLSSLVVLPTISYPSVHLLVMGLILFHLFYARASGANPVVIVLAVIGVLIIPLVGSISRTLAVAIAWGLTLSALFALVFVYLAAAVFPDPPALGATVAEAAPETREEGAAGAGGGDSEISGGSEVAGGSNGGSAPEATDGPESTGDSAGQRPAAARALEALRSLIVIYPLYVYFLFTNSVDSAVILVFAALLGLEPAFGEHWVKGKGLILANVAGGLVAVLIFNALVIVPTYGFFLLIITLAGLLVGRMVFSGSPMGALLAGGITTVFIVLGPTLTGDAEAGAKLYTRIAQITAAVLYVVFMFAIQERLGRKRRARA